jgi:hypothetical protein
MDDLKQRAEHAARAAGSTDLVARRVHMSRFMGVIEEIAERIAAGKGSWEALQSFAQRTAPLVLAAREELLRWSGTIWNGAYSGGEEDAELALRRSQEEFARELFRGTIAEPHRDPSLVVACDRGDAPALGREQLLSQDG